MGHDINCPYCNHPQDICHDDGYGYAEGVKHQQYCGKCEKNFVFETSVSFYYEAEKADCLNDGEHDWQLTKTFPEFLKQMKCKTCDEERKLTEAERIKYNVPTYEEYLEKFDK